MDSKKKQEQKLEEQFRDMGEKEMEELKLPESLKPENIKKRILEYEAGGQNAGAQEQGRQKTGGRQWRTRSIWISAAAAMLVLVLGAGSLAVSSGHLNQGGEQSSQMAADTAGAGNGEADAGMAETTEDSADAGVMEETACENRQEDVLTGIRKVSDYAELLTLCKEAGIMKRQEEREVRKPTLWEKLTGIFSGEVKDEIYFVENAEIAVDDAYSAADKSEASAGTMNGGMSEGGAIIEENTEAEQPNESVEQDYSDTNVQVEGVDESDIIKTDGTCIYRLSSDRNEIVIYRADGAAVELAGSIALEPYNGGEQEGYRSYSDMLLADGYLAVLGQLTVYERYDTPDRIYVEDEVMAEEDAVVDVEVPSASYWGLPYGRTSTTQTELTVYDVSDPAAPKKVDTRIQEGSYQGVRMVDGIIYLMSYKYNSSYFICEEEEETDYFTKNYIPRVDGELLDCGRIYLPQEPQTPNCLIITSTDIHAPGRHLDSVAILGDATQMYVSNRNIYLWQTEWSWWTPQEEQPETTTTIMKYAYQNGYLSAAGSAQVKGYLNNSFSMDEYQGYLRVITTNEYEKSVQRTDSRGGEIQESTWTTENQLYVLDEAMQIVGSIEDLAEGEYVKSARFFGNIGYFVTFRQTDPLFSVDLSNPARPRIIGKLKIPGFSEYLHLYGDGLLLGIGQEADETSGGTEGVKLSMFDISNPADVKEAAKCLVREADSSWSDAEYNHRAILVSPGKNLIGFSLQAGSYSGQEWKNTWEYCVFSYENGEFVERITHDFGDWENLTDSRGIYIGDYLYIVYANRQVAVYRLSDGADCGLYDFR